MGKFDVENTNQVSADLKQLFKVFESELNPPENFKLENNQNVIPAEGHNEWKLLNVDSKMTVEEWGKDFSS
jgi:hypothetical protein